MIDFPDKKYQVIYADPPWQYKDKQNARSRGASYKYQVQDIEWIKSLPVADISDDNCVLFLWVTFPMLPDALAVISAWGFKYRTVAFNWVKKNKIKDSWFWGMGNYTRSNSEVCLLAVKGKNPPKRISNSVHSVVDARIKAHSKKPDEVRDRIVHLMGDVPRIELFARNHTEGWDVWGNEV